MCRRYLIQYHSGPYIDMLTAELRMANLCATYLTFEMFSTVMKDEDLRDLVSAGAFAFQEYATLHWLDHSNCSRNLGMSDENAEIASLNKSCWLLASLHAELSSYREGVSSRIHGRIGHHQESQPDLTLVKKSYETVYSLSNEEEHQGKLLVSYES